ncbi:alanine racemase [candidate division WOR-3 bacterium]|nr:alanine racemase [candidate division WOR-3 bacterium]
MSRLIIDLEALHHNIETIDGWVRDHGATWTLVTKALSGHLDTIRALQALGVRSMADSRVDNLRAIARISPGFESWYLRPPRLTYVRSVVEVSDVSLNSELQVIDEIDRVAGALGKTHHIIIMIELGDLREGILPGSLIGFYNHVFRLDHVEVLGIGANLGCLAGIVPTVDQMMQLVLYRELLQLKFNHSLRLISAGSSALLPMLLEGRVPGPINHFRVGEAVFLGSDLIHGGTLQELRDDAFTLEAEIVEIKEKSLAVQTDGSGIATFEPVCKEEFAPGQRGFRALLAVGQLDTDVKALTPTNPNVQLAGASSDVMVVNLGDNPDGLKVGDTLKFRPAYSALVRLMVGKYMPKIVTPEVGEFKHLVSGRDPLELSPAVPDSAGPTTPGPVPRKGTVRAGRTRHADSRSPVGDAERELREDQDETT